MIDRSHDLRLLCGVALFVIGGEYRFAEAAEERAETSNLCVGSGVEDGKAKGFQ